MTKIINNSKRFFEIFKDDNDWNEKSIVGFIAFAVMVLVFIVDFVCSGFGINLEIEKYVYETFFWLVVSCFGISATENIFGKKTKSNKTNKEAESNE